MMGYMIPRRFSADDMLFHILVTYLCKYINQLHTHTVDYLGRVGVCGLVMYLSIKTTSTSAENPICSFASGQSYRAGGPTALLPRQYEGPCPGAISRHLPAVLPPPLLQPPPWTCTTDAYYYLSIVQ